MIIPDVNLLLYAYDSTSPHNSKCRVWWQECLSGTEQVGLPHVVVFAFLRIGTNPRAFSQPMRIAEAIGHVRSWLMQRNCELLEPARDHVEHVFKLLENLGTAGNLASDAQVAALAIEHNAVLHTADTDFIRFQGLRWYNPLTRMGSGALRRTRKT